MTREERRRLLGDSVVEAIHARVAEAPTPTEDDAVISDVRRILTRPAGHTVTAASATDQTAA